MACAVQRSTFCQLETEVKQHFTNEQMIISSKWIHKNYLISNSK